MKSLLFIINGILLMGIALLSVIIALLGNILDIKIEAISSLIFILMGLYFVSVGIKDLKQSSLLNVALIISLIGVIFFLINLFLTIYGCTHNPSKQVGCVFPLWIGAAALKLLNFISLILVIIYYFITKRKSISK